MGHRVVVVNDMVDRGKFCSYTETVCPQPLQDALKFFSQNIPGNLVFLIDVHYTA